MLDAALKTLIAGVAGVSPRVNPGTDMVNVTKDLPRTTYTLIDDPRSYTDSGAMGLGKAHYQLDIFAADYDEARAIGRKIMAPATKPQTPGLDGYSGTIKNTKIHRIYFPNNGIAKGEASTGQNQAVARATLDVLIDYRELQ